jgi:hypothetical protein
MRLVEMRAGSRYNGVIIRLAFDKRSRSLGRDHKGGQQMCYRALAFGTVFVSMGALGPGTPARAATPTLCVIVEQGVPIIGLPTEFRIQLGEGDTEIVGGQFTLEYDPEALTFSSALPGAACDASSPFSLLGAPVVDESAGRVQFDVSVPLLAPGSTGPAVMACMNFIPIGNAATSVCLVNRLNGLSFLFDSAAFIIIPVSGETCPADAPSISCAEVADPLPNECAEMDSDDDGDIDLDDFAAFQRCLTPPLQRATNKSAP